MMILMSYCFPARSVRISAALVSGLTLGMTFSTTPFSSMIKVLRNCLTMLLMISIFYLPERVRKGGTEAVFPLFPAILNHSAIREDASTCLTKNWSKVPSATRGSRIWLMASSRAVLPFFTATP